MPGGEQRWMTFSMRPASASALAAAACRSSAGGRLARSAEAE